MYVTKIVKIQIKNVQNWSERFTVEINLKFRKKIQKKKNEKRAYSKLPNFYIKINQNKFIIDDN